MLKKEYTTPNLEDMGDFNSITGFNYTGDGKDGAFPEETPDIFS